MTRLSIEHALELAAAERRQGHPERAQAICRQIVAQHPGHAQALSMLASLLADDGRLPEAAATLRQLVQRRPDDEGASVGLASLLRRQALHDEAAAVLQAALLRFPDSSAVCQGLGLVERARGDLDAAIGWLQRAVQGRPDSVEARNNLGLTLTEAGRPEAAEEQLRAALRSGPAVAELHYNLGIALAALGQYTDAAAAYSRAVELKPDYVEALINLGATQKLLGQLDAAIASFERALRLQPERAATHSHLAGIYEWQARHDEALAAHQRAAALAPDDALIRGNCLFTLLFHPEVDAQALRRAHEDWDRQHARPLPRLAAPQDRDRSPGRRLRIGYVSAHFRDHVVGRNLLPLLREHDRAAVEVVCYANSRTSDDLTGRFRRLADLWRDISRLADADAASLIRADRIDILIDTTLHMEGNRLLVFARRPAPVQVTFAGYPGSTGLAAIDYRLTDVHLDPPDQDDAVYVEHSVRLPETFWCYDPLGDDVAVGPLPADREGRVTFGCLNNFSKVNDRVLELWARVLRAVAGARLHLLCHEGSHRQRTLQALHRLGIEPQRIEFFGYRPRADYLALFRDIDISLDTVPYNGHTTSLDSLWMGVPVVTLVGGTVVGRAGLSQMTNLGLPELIARSAQQYESIAAGLAADRDRLRELRRSLRSRMQRSPLMDAPRFARRIEAACRQMWQRWCAQANDGAGRAARP